MKPTAPFSQRASILAVSLLTVPFLSAAPIAITATGNYSQNFDTLPTTGVLNSPTTPATAWVDDSLIPSWYASYASGSAPSIPASTGSDTSGTLYSYGSSAATDRALGSQGSNSLAPSGQPAVFYGVLFRNTGSTEEEIDTLGYTGEQWRDGNNANKQSLKLEYLVVAPDTDGNPPTLASTGWIEIPSLKFTGPKGSTAAAALDGNLAENRVALSATSPGIYVPPGQYLMLRWTDTNDSGNDHGLAIDDFSASWKLSTGDHTKPVVTSLYPADNSTASADFTTSLTLTFNENVQPGTGNVELRKADNTLVKSFGIADSTYTVFSGNTVTITMPDTSLLLAKNTSYFVNVPATAIKDIASTPNFFAGFSGATGWNFVTPAPSTPKVVINKYANGGAGNPDTVELLVVGTGVAGSTVDMRGMILKDFSGNGLVDNGGYFTFSDAALWAAVPAGTLIVLTTDTNTTDTTVGGTDFNLAVGLQDTTYFTASSNTFDIATTEMVMIKAKDSGPAGTTGGIHLLAGLNPAEHTLYADFAGPKAVAPNGNSNVAIKNTNGTIADFQSDYLATDAVSGDTSSFGAPNSPGNAAFINSLRGIVAGSGDGLAVVTNTTSSSPYLGTSYFAGAQTGQTVKVSLNSYAPGVTLNKAEITVPVEFGVPGTVTLSGAGAGSATVTKSGQVITVTGAAATAANALEVNIQGLSTPAAPTTLTSPASFDFLVKTAGTGSLVAIADQPTVRLPIPMSLVHAVDANGVSNADGMIVALDGVVTAADLDASGTVSGFMQDTTGGINVFQNAFDPALVRGHRFVVTGLITAFNGQTEIKPISTATVSDLGTATPPTPETVTLATLLANAETYEGKLIKIQGLSRSSADADSWVAGSTITAQDSSAATIDIRIATGSTATTEPTYPADITGIFGQFDASSPYTSGYQISPRDPADISSGTTPTNNYASWATSHGVGSETATADHDGDGISNLLEYALGLDPLVGNSLNSTFNASTRTLTFTKGTEAVANGDVTYTIESSTTLASGSWTAVTPTTNNSTTISYVIPAGQTKVFVRLSVAQNP